MTTEIFKRSYGTAILNWLQGIIRDRYGHNFDVARGITNTLIVSLPGDRRQVTLSSNPSVFKLGESALPVAQWDAMAEGWQSSIAPTIPAIGVKDLPVPLIELSQNGMHVGYDILGMVYWVLTRQEEIGRTDLDLHGRFPAANSHAYKCGYLERPIVDEWLHILGQVFSRNWPGIKLKKQNYKLALSHDVDEPSRYGFRSARRLARAMIGDVLRRRDFKSAAYAPWIRLNTRNHLHAMDPCNTFDWIMDVSEHHSLESAFYFICGHTAPGLDGDYDLGHPAIRSLLRRIYDRGHQIGLHPSYGTYQDSFLLKLEANRLRSVAAQEGIVQQQWGGRMHYLRWSHPTTMLAWNAAGLNYDSTLGYADRPGFRCGTGFEYQAFDPTSDEPLALRIQPLVAMDVSIMSSEYLGLGHTNLAVDKVSKLSQACRYFGSTFSLLWHNSQLTTQADKNLYKEILLEIKV